MRTCPFCGSDHDPEDEDEHNSTWQQWQCQECAKWVDRDD